MTSAAIAASSAREMVLSIPMPFRFTYTSGKRLSEGGIRLIRYLALLHSFGDCHQCRSNPANLLLYGLGFGWSCFGVLRRYYNNYEMVSANQQGTCFIWAF